MQQETKLKSYHMRCLHSICSIRWRDKIRNEVILQRTGM